MVWILLGIATARLSHVTTASIVIKTHTNWRTHERCFMTASGIRKATTTPCIVIERWSILRRTLPLLWWSAMRWLLMGGHTVSIRRLRSLEWLLLWLLRTILWLLTVCLRSVVGMIVLSRQRSRLRSVLHGRLLRVLLLRRTVMRLAVLLGVLVVLPLRTRVATLLTLRARSLRTYVWGGILLTIGTVVARW